MKEENTSSAGIADDVLYNCLAHSCLDKMDMLLSKLQLLNYEKDFLHNSSLDSTPLSREYFAIAQNNTIVQFHQFTLIISWLFNSIRQNSFHVDEFDDPSTIVHKITVELKILGFTENISASRVKQGHGTVVLDILHFLADKALINSNFSFQAPIYPEAHTKPETNDEEWIGQEVSDDEEDQFYHDTSTDESLNSSNSISIQMIESKIDTKEWQEEFERITHLLTADESSALKYQDDWRHHFQQFQVYVSEVKDKSPKAISHLERFCNHLESDMECIQAKENILTNEFENFCKEYVEKKTELNKYKADTQHLRRDLDTKSKKLIEIKRKMKEHKEILERRGDSMTDTSPLINLKDALSRIKEEIKEFDLQISLLDNILIKASLQESYKTSTENNLPDSDSDSDSETSSKFGSDTEKSSLQQ